MGVELGAGLGLPSLCGAHLGLHMLATDGDADVLDLLAQNVARNLSSARRVEAVDDKQSLSCVKGSVRVVPLRWGETSDPLRELGLVRAPDLIMGSGIVYGKEVTVFRALADTLRRLCGPHTLVLLGHGQV